VRDVKRLTALLVTLSSGPAFAHGGGHSEIGWTLDPSVTVPLILAAAI
jgi:hypothetical protein